MKLQLFVQASEQANTGINAYKTNLDFTLSSIKLTQLCIYREQLGSSFYMFYLWIDKKHTIKKFLFFETIFRMAYFQLCFITDLLIKPAFDH